VRKPDLSGGLIERVARQLCVAARIDPDKHIAGNGYAMGEGRHSAWIAFQGEARAILEAMRDPPRSILVDAGRFQAQSGRATSRDIWAAMIDQALAEEHH
jgi:hypothetical protein